MKKEIYLIISLMFVILLILGCYQYNIQLKNTSKGFENKTYCKDPRPEFCTQEYVPVCGSDGITYSNGCSACANEDVIYWIPGDCSVVPI